MLLITHHKWRGVTWLVRRARNLDPRHLTEEHHVCDNRHQKVQEYITLLHYYFYIRLFLTQLRFARYIRDVRGMVRRVYTAIKPNRRITDSAEFALAARVSAW